MGRANKISNPDVLAKGHTRVRLTTTAIVAGFGVGLGRSQAAGSGVVQATAVIALDS